MSSYNSPILVIICYAKILTCWYQVHFVCYLFHRVGAAIVTSNKSKKKIAGTQNYIISYLLKYTRAVLSFNFYAKYCTLLQ